MTEENKGKKPDKEGGAGLQNEGEEVGGRSAGALYICWNCGAGNYVPSFYDYFICWNCGALNWM